MKRWSKSKHYAGKNGNQQSERQHHPVDSDFVEPGKVRGHKAQDETQSKHCGCDSRGAADERQQQGLSQHLAHHAAAARPQR
jgi:hypothetical protein